MRKLLFLLIVMFAGLTVYGQVSASFTIDHADGCAPHVVHFTNTSTGATSYSWDLGNGTVTPVTNPSTSYLTVGTYTVVLTATNGSSTSTSTQVITVHPAPTVIFSAPDTSICPGQSVPFTNSSISGVPGALTYIWNFGDGSTSMSASPTHTFSVPGDYNITLTVTNAEGCTSSLTRSAYMHVNTPPSVGFSASPTAVCNPPGTVTFTNYSTGAPPPLSYAWSFGFGPPSTLATPSNVYTTPGLYTVRLTVTDGNGCTDSLVRPNYIYVGVVHASFTSPATVCRYSNVTFSNTSSAHTSRTWDYGDGSLTDTAYNGSHSYSIPGTYTVSLTVHNGPCTDVISNVITVLPPSGASFTISPTDPCPAPVTLTYNGSAPAGSTVTWIYEGGATGSGLTGTHHYTTNGIKTVKMIVTTAAGCVDTVTAIDTILDLHLATTASPLSGCVPLTVTFGTNLLTYEPYGIAHAYPHGAASYNWNFGDGSATSGAAAPSHTYTAVGIYWTMVTVVTDNGCTVQDSVRILVGSPPVITASVTPTHVCLDDSVTFTATVITGPVDSYDWYFGDGSISTPGPIVKHRYSIPGYFTATVIPSYLGCYGPAYVISTIITVDSPAAFITSTFACTPPTRVYFYDSSMGDDSHLWMFSDGTTSTADDPVHDFPSIATYTVSLATYNATSGCRDTATAIINLISPVLDFTADDTDICMEDTVHFTSTVTGGVLYSYQWSVGSTVRPWWTNTTMTDTFYVPGHYTVELTAVDDRGCPHSVSRPDYITVGKPAAHFMAVPNPGCLPLTVTFTDTSTDVSGVLLSAFAWDFGDGSTATVSTPATTHTYTAPGTFSVTEIVTDIIGCMDTIDAPSLITVYHPTAAFTASTQHPCQNTPMTFYNSSVGIVSSLWMFGDGTTSSSTSPVHIYSATGTYTVKLVVTDPHGCTDTVTHVGYINVAKPDAAFTVSDSVSVCPPLMVVFTNMSTGATSYDWDFGDGNISSFSSPSNVYLSPGSYTARLIAHNSWGCTDTAYQHISVYGYAGALSYSPLTGCSPLQVNFTAAVSNVPHITWDFGDGTTSAVLTVDTISHWYTIAGAYIPKLILADNTGCQNSSVGLDTIKVDGIKVKIGISPAACIGSPFNFVDSSSWYWSPIDTWQWVMGTDTSTLESPDTIINVAGSYPVTLTVSNGWGCTATLTDNIIVHPLPDVNASVDTVVCLTDPATLWGYGAATYAWYGPPGTLSCMNCNPMLATPTVVSTYSVVGTDQYGCKDTTDVTVGIRTQTFANAWQDTVICFGGVVPLFDTGGDRYTWMPPGGLSNNTISNPMASPGTSLTYTVVAQLASCLPDTDYVRVDVHSLPTVDAGPDQEVQAGVPAQLQAVASNATTYQWTPTTGLSCFDCPGPDASVSVTTTYVVTVTTPYGCKQSDSVTVYLYCNSKQVFVPNVFTPNNDGLNDVFYPRGVGIRIVTSFRIYNRWGELLFERTNFNVNDDTYAWDGSYKGGDPRPDVYVYVIDAICSTGKPVMIKGDVTIVR